MMHFTAKRSHFCTLPASFLNINHLHKSSSHYTLSAKKKFTLSDKFFAGDEILGQRKFKADENLGR